MEVSGSPTLSYWLAGPCSGLHAKSIYSKSPCLVGGDGGLDGLGGPGVQLGSPDKKKRKSNAQVRCFVFILV